MARRTQRGRWLLIALLAGALMLEVGTSAMAAEPAPTLDETIAARSMFFGAENVDQTTGAMARGEVHLSWVSVATFAAAMDGHVVLFDAYIHKGEDVPSYVPATVRDLIDLAPEYIFLGHGHFDHAAEAGRIAAATSATVVGTAHHCTDQTTISGETFDCLAAFQDTAAFGDTATLDLWEGVCTTAVLHVHSAEEPPDPDHPVQNTVVPIPDGGNVLNHPPGPGLSESAGADGDEGGTVLYQFRMGDFSLLMHDSSGPLKERAPEVLDVLEALPATDVEFGAILGFNQVTNGLRDPAMYAAAIGAQVYVPVHHDFVTEYGSSDDFESVLLDEFAFYGADPELRFLYDPYDYVRPNLLRYDIDAPRWKVVGDDVCARAPTSDVTATGVTPAPDAEAGGGGDGLAATGAGGLLAVAGLGIVAMAAMTRRRRLS